MPDKDRRIEIGRFYHIKDKKGFWTLDQIYVNFEGEKYEKKF